jgi:hypothetical protein
MKPIDLSTLSLKQRKQLESYLIYSQIYKNVENSKKK